MLEEMKAALRDDSIHIAIAKIKGLHLADDRSSLKVTCDIFPEEREVIAIMSWDSIGPESGTFTFPNIDDLVLLGCTEDEEHIFVLKRLTSLADKIPINATDGSTVIKALAGKKIWLTSNAKINLSKGDAEPTENIILGQVFKQFAIDLLTAVSDHLNESSTETHTGNLGFLTGPPTNAGAYTTLKTAIDDLKASPINDSSILSDISFTEK